MVRKLWQGLIEDGLKVSIAQLCDWFGRKRCPDHTPVLNAQGMS